MPSERKTVIKYAAFPNRNKTAGGFLPVIYINGKLHGTTYYWRGLPEATALIYAQHDAADENERHYGGEAVLVHKEIKAKNPSINNEEN